MSFLSNLSSLLNFCPSEDEKLELARIEKVKKDKLFQEEELHKKKILEEKLKQAAIKKEEEEKLLKLAEEEKIKKEEELLLLKIKEQEILKRKKEKEEADLQRRRELMAKEILRVREEAKTLEKRKKERIVREKRMKERIVREKRMNDIRLKNKATKYISKKPSVIKEDLNNIVIISDNSLDISFLKETIFEYSKDIDISSFESINKYLLENKNGKLFFIDLDYKKDKDIKNLFLSRELNHSSDNLNIIGFIDSNKYESFNSFGFSDVISKPFNKDNLKQLLKKYI